MDTPSCFIIFPNLPPEIRIAIWRTALCQPTVVGISAKTGDRNLGSGAHLANISLSCREALCEFEKLAPRPGLPRTVPHRTIIYVPDGPVDVAERMRHVNHLAYPFFSEYWLWRNLTIVADYLPAVRSVTVVVMGEQRPRPWQPQDGGGFAADVVARLEAAFDEEGGCDVDLLGYNDLLTRRTRTRTLDCAEEQEVRGRTPRLRFVFCPWS